MKLKVDVRTYTMVAALITIWVMFYLLEPTFLRARNLSNLARQMSETGILAIGMVYVIVSGNIDLSVGSLAGLTGGIAAMVNVWANQGSSASVGGAVVAGLVAGTLQGVIVAYRRIPAFIVTLGGLMAFRGTLWAATKAKSIPLRPGFFKDIGKGYLPQVWGWVFAGAVVSCIVFSAVKRARQFRKFRGEAFIEKPGLARSAILAALTVLFVFVMSSYEGVSYPVLILVALSALLHVLFRRTRFGRHVYAIGGNPEAARLSGINVRKNILVVFMLMGFLSAVAGVVMTSRLACSSSTTGQLMELNAIAACVIGGCSLMGGRGKISGAILGALIMSSLDNGLSLQNVDIAYQYIIKGFALVIAVSIDVASKRRNG